ARPVLQDEAAIDVVEDAVEDDGRHQDVVQVTEQRNEVGDEVERAHQIDRGGRQRDLGRPWQYGVGDESRDETRHVRQRLEQRPHGSRLSATRSLTSLTASVSSASFTFRPRSTMARQNGHAVPTTLAVVAINSSTRTTFTRFSAFTSIHMWPPPPPQQRPRSRLRGGSITRRPG